ncbi:DUF6387 family protein [Legionella bozemanae]|uniref:DUF6387 family protein n=1 Tax=Legionella bozemanae TaxID=447 RepID=UPI00399D0DB9
MLKIKEKKDLPEWYDIKKYDAAKNFKAIDWYQQFFVRRFCLEIGYKDNFVKKLIDAIRENPIVDLINDERFSVIKSMSILGNGLSFMPGVHPMTLHEFVVIEKEIDPIKLEHARNWSQQNHLNPKVFYKNEIDSSTSLLNPNFREFFALSVNTNLPRLLLMKQFEALLDVLQINNLKESGKQYKTSDYQKWHKYGVLPYHDLDVWRKEEQKDITESIFSKVVNANEERGEENIRKTTAELSKTLILDESLNYLAAQAYIEMMK